MYLLMTQKYQLEFLGVYSRIIAQWEPENLGSSSSSTVTSQPGLTLKICCRRLSLIALNFLFCFSRRVLQPISLLATERKWLYFILCCTLQCLAKNIVLKQAVSLSLLNILSYILGRYISYKSLCKTYVCSLDVHFSWEQKFLSCFSLLPVEPFLQ